MLLAAVILYVRRKNPKSITWIRPCVELRLSRHLDLLVSRASADLCGRWSWGRIEAKLTSRIGMRAGLSFVDASRGQGSVSPSLLASVHTHFVSMTRRVAMGTRVRPVGRDDGAFPVIDRCAALSRGHVSSCERWNASIHSLEG